MSKTVSVGGAPIYGADAIAGVVNIILKKDYQGLDVDAQVGASGQGDAWNYRTRILAGQNLFDGRANITAVAEFTKTDGLRRHFPSGVRGRPRIPGARDARQIHAGPDPGQLRTAGEFRRRSVGGRHASGAGDFGVPTAPWA